MNARINYQQAAPDAVKAVYGLENYVRNEAGLDPTIIHLIKLRASIQNGCAFCVDMHSKEARKDGLSNQWIALVSAWREALVFSARERAVLAWTDAVTNIAQTGAPDVDFDALKTHFSDEEIVRMTVAIGTINIWNRLAVAMRTPHPVDNAS